MSFNGNGAVMIYTICISRHLTSKSTTPTDHPAYLLMGEIWDRLPGNQIDYMNSSVTNRKIFYFKLCELDEIQTATLDNAVAEQKRILLDCFSPEEISVLEWPGVLPPGLGGDISFSNIKVI
jgi:hypothetical protein